MFVKKKKINFGNFMSKKKKLKDSQNFFDFFYNFFLRKKSFESFNISENNIISVEAFNVLGYVGLGNR
jgi:hypothetical protein